MTLVTPDVRAPCHSWPLAFEADMTGHAFRSAIADGISIYGSPPYLLRARHVGSPTAVTSLKAV